MMKRDESIVVQVAFKGAIELAVAGKIEIADVRAAINRRMKNMVPHIVPPVNCAKTVGNTTKINPGPSAGLAPKAKTVVKIATPASMAMAVSKKRTHRAEFIKFCFLSR